MAKGVVKGYGAAALGTIGLAAGVATGDFENVGKYAVAGGIAGAHLGEKAAGLPSAAYRRTKEISNGMRDIRDTYEKEALSKDEYKKRMNARADKEFMKDKETKQLYEDAFKDSGIDYKEAMEKAKEYRSHGITDDETIIKAMKVKSKGLSQDIADPKRIVSAKLASQITNEKDVETMEKRLRERGVPENNVKEQSDVLRKMKGLV